MTRKKSKEKSNILLNQLFVYYNNVYFQNKLIDCKVGWSSDRMTSTAGYCRYTEGEGCIIRISEPLHRLRPSDDLKNTLLHEMIHGIALLDNNGDDRDGHGPEFQKLMNFVNESTLPDIHRPEDGYNITVFHEFVDEAEYYRRHWWKCENCGNEVKRACNRKPQEADCTKMNIKEGMCHDRYCLWHVHLKDCGGEYIKTKEPLKLKKRLVSSIMSPMKKRRKILNPKYSTPTRKRKPENGDDVAEEDAEPNGNSSVGSLKLQDRQVEKKQRLVHTPKTVCRSV